MVPFIAKDQSEAVKLNALRFGSCYLGKKKNLRGDEEAVPFSLVYVCKKDKTIEILPSH